VGFARIPRTEGFLAKIQWAPTFQQAARCRGLPNRLQPSLGFKRFDLIEMLQCQRNMIKTFEKALPAKIINLKRSLKVHIVVDGHFLKVDG
jgi:hypothetical protein